MVWETEDTIDIILSVVITALGLIPAIRAVKLKIVECLRYE